MLNDGEIYAGGLDLKFYPSEEFEPDLPEISIESYRIKARNLLRVLMMGWTPNWRNLLSWHTFRAVVADRDHNLTQAMRYAFQQGFVHIFEQLNHRQTYGPPLNELEERQAHLFINSCLAYFPYADPSSYESIAIPQHVDGRWQLIHYKVVPIELTPASGFKKLFLADHDRVFAHGLEPIHHPTAEPHLTFMGTTYPAGQGFSTTINTDLEAFETPGKKLYRSGRENITRWLDQQTKPVHVCGTSLGGALSLLLAIDQGPKLSRVDAINPPGLYHSWRKSKFDHWDEFDDEQKPQVFIQENAGDPVSHFGIKKKEWNVLQVTPPENKRGPNALAHHALNYSGFADTTFIGVSPTRANEERRHRNWWIYSILRSAVYYIILVPFRYSILPALRFAFNHKMQIALSLVFTAIFSLFPVPLAAISATFALNSILPAVISGYLASTLIHYAADLFTNKRNSNLSKFLDFLAMHPNLKLAVGLAAAVMIASIAIGLFLFPAIVSTLAVAFVSLPSVYAVIDSIIDQVMILFGFKQVALPKCHEPTLERNLELDNYQKTDSAKVEVTFTYAEVGQYHKAKRDLKGKAFLTASDDIKEFKSTGLTKRQVLDKSQDNDSCLEKITFFASKAKAHDMRRTLSQLERNDHDGVQQHHREYVRGKSPQ